MSADSVGGDRPFLTRLRSGERKLQRWDNRIVLPLIYGAYRARSVFPPYFSA